MTTQNTTIPTGDNRLLEETRSTKKVGWLERTIGTDLYRILQGWLKHPPPLLG